MDNPKVIPAPCGIARIPTYNYLIVLTISFSTRWNMKLFGMLMLIIFRTPFIHNKYVGNIQWGLNDFVTGVR